LEKFSKFLSHYLSVYSEMKKMKDLHQYDLKKYQEIRKQTWKAFQTSEMQDAIYAMGVNWKSSNRALASEVLDKLDRLSIVTGSVHDGGTLRSVEKN